MLFGLKRVPDLRRAQRMQIAQDHLRLVSLEKFARSHVHELSGGMKQRAAFARALAPDPRVLLIDEPLSAPDALTPEQLYDDIQRIWQAKHETIVLLTHNVTEAACLGDRVVVISAGPGHIAETFEITLPPLPARSTCDVAWRRIAAAR
ncbi:MAG: ATP-binding cassette domain-containing protein [Acetobacteraceae bacterium]|nr:ATP-binding cassette domain-containing protein [Acetobacteraceae bacterium]